MANKCRSPDHCAKKYCKDWNIMLCYRAYYIGAGQVLRSALWMGMFVCVVSIILLINKKNNGNPRVLNHIRGIGRCASIVFTLSSKFFHIKAGVVVYLLLIVYVSPWYPEQITLGAEKSASWHSEYTFFPKASSSLEFVIQVIFFVFIEVCNNHWHLLHHRSGRRCFDYHHDTVGSISYLPYQYYHRTTGHRLGHYRSDF